MQVGKVQKAEWVIGRYKGKKAMRVKDCADVGLGYHVRREEGKGATYEVTVAFTRAIDSPLPHHLVRCTPEQCKKLEELQIKRAGIYKSNTQENLT